MIPYSFCGESVKEKAIVAFPRSPTEMLLGLSRSEWLLLLSDFVEKIISGWTTFVVVSLTRDAAKSTIAEGKRGRRKDLQNINLMCYIHAKRGKAFFHENSFFIGFKRFLYVGGMKNCRIIIAHESDDISWIYS